MKPQCESAEYRRLYARCCQHLRANYGLVALPFHSYESVVLLAAFVDAKLIDVERIPTQKCCRLKRAPDLDRSDDAEIGRFCSSLSMLLADIKLCDDKRDSRSQFARGYHWLLRRRIGAAREWFAQFDTAFEERIDGFVSAHLATENPSSLMSVEDYSAPTADGFSYVFALSAVGLRSGRCREFLAALGRQIGTAIIAFDCAMDWQDDLRSGNFNPVTNHEQAREALALCAERLRDAEEACLDRFGPASGVASIVASVRRRIAGLSGESNGAEEAGASELLERQADSKERRSARSRIAPALAYSDCLGGGGLGLCLCLLCCASSVDRACKQNEARKDPFERDHPCAFGCLKCCCEEGAKEGCKQCR